MMDIAPLPESIRNAIYPAGFIRSLGRGATLDEALGRQRPNAAWGEISVTDAAKAIVLHTIELATACELLSPAAAAFSRKYDLELAALDSLRVLVARLLSQLVAENDNADGCVAAEDEHHELAFEYAAALLTQEETLRALQLARVASPMLDGAVDGLDRRRLEDCLLNLSMNGPIKTLDRMVQKWERLVAHLEGEHTSLLYEEYKNDLASRDSLEDVLSLLSPRARAVVEPRIRKTDERFATATKSLTAPHTPHSPWIPQRWWWWQVPSDPGELFREYLERATPAGSQTRATPRSGTDAGPRLPDRD